MARRLAGALLAVAALAGLTAVAPATAQQVAAADVAQLWRDLRAQRDALDYEAMARSAAALAVLRPGQPRALEWLALAEAGRGREAAALAVLERLARMGLTLDLAQPEFVRLRSAPRYAGLAAQLGRNALPAGHAGVHAELREPGAGGFVPEGIAFDARSGDLFLGSVRQARIVRLAADGSAQAFAPRGAAAPSMSAPAQGPLWSVFGMAVDPARRLLWVTTAAIPEMTGYTDALAGRTALVAFDLDSGAERLRAEGGAGSARRLGDLALAPDGTVFASDAAGGLYALPPGATALQLRVAASALPAPQGLAFAADGGAVYVADYVSGLLRLDLARNELQRMEVPEDVCVTGIDALVRAGADLLAVQNGVAPARVLRLRLDDSGTRIAGAQRLAAVLPEFDEPTLGVVAGEDFLFVANSHWNRFDAQGNLPDAESLSPPQVLSLPLTPAALVASLERRLRRAGRVTAEIALEATPAAPGGLLAKLSGRLELRPRDVMHLRLGGAWNEEARSIEQHADGHGLRREVDGARGGEDDAAGANDRFLRDLVADGVLLPQAGVRREHLPLAQAVREVPGRSDRITLAFADHPDTLLELDAATLLPVLRRERLAPSAGAADVIEHYEFELDPAVRAPPRAVAASACGPLVPAACRARTPALRLSDRLAP